MPNYVGEQRRAMAYDICSICGTNEWGSFLNSPPGSAYHDCNGRLYVVTYDADDPDNHEMHISRWGTGLHLAGADYVRIRNLEFRYYGDHGVYLDKPGADHNIIEGNVFHGIGRYHIRARVGVAPPYSSDNLIQDNSFYEYGYRDGGWPWDLQKNYAFSVGVRLSHAGSGNVIRRNAFKSGQDAINVDWQSHNTDVYDNVIEEYMGDGIGVDDQPGYNTRVWGNVIRYRYSSISNQDWFTGDYWKTGPVYIFPNVIQGGFDPQGRTDVEGGIAGYYTNYGFKVGTDEETGQGVFTINFWC